MLGLALFETTLVVDLRLGIVGDAHQDDALRGTVDLTVSAVVAFDPGAISSLSVADAMGQRGQRRLGGRRHRIGTTCGSQFDAFGDHGRHRQALEAATEVIRCTKAEVAHLRIALTRA